MLNSLHIENYRNLQELKMDSLSQINLITGKNNTGKSSILEALAIYAGKGDCVDLHKLLEYRGEFFDQLHAKDFTELNMRSLASLFTDRKGIFDGKSIVIGNDETSLSLRFVQYFDELQTEEQGKTIRKRQVVSKKNEGHKYVDARPGFEISFNNEYAAEYQVLPLYADRLPRLKFHELNMLSERKNYRLVRAGDIDKEDVGKLFDSIALSEKENAVIEALKIIDPCIERIAFIDDSARGRTAVVKRSGESETQALRSMGDGVNRILTIILAMVNCNDGFLLIDEFENGLHYSVQTALWSVIFKLSKTLNIQVFATTHSNDCIASFESVLNDTENTINGQVIRLDNINGQIKQVAFSPEELRTANNQNIEIR